VTVPGYLLVIDDNPTVLKVVELALSEVGYQTATASDVEVGLALVRDARTAPDLVLLAGSLPGVDAAAFCRRLAEDDQLGRVPIVVMQSRGQASDVEARFAKASNVVDYISKPFSPDALQAVVSHAVGQPSRGSRDARARAGAGLADIALGAAIDEALSRSADRDVAEARAFAAEGYALGGNLHTFSTGQALETLAEQGGTGVLRVINTESHGRVEIYVRGGRIDFAAAVGVGEDFLLGRFTVESGEVSAAALADVLHARARATGDLPLFGADLIARGLITRESLARAMARQTSELVYETLRWHAGLFLFRQTDALPAVAVDAALALSVDRVLLEGYRRVDEWHVIEREVQSFDEVFVRNESKILSAPRGTFTRDELAILDEIDGRHTVRDIVRALRMGSFDVSKAVYRFKRTRLIRARVPPVALG
jgi:CheY-like chemotaxis protein